MSQQNTDQQLILMRNFDLWSHLSDEDYELLNLVHHFLEASKDEYIYFEKAHHNKLYFLKEGYIKLGFIDEEGKEIVKEVLQKGDIFGQFTLLPNNQNGEYAMAYKSDVSLCAFNITDFEKLLQQKPTLAIQFTRMVGNKLKRVENRLVNLLHKDVKSRLVHFLLVLAAPHPADHSGFIRFQNFLTHEDIAHLIGSSRQTVTSLLNQFEDLGYLKVSRSTIIISDVKALQKILNVG